MKHVNALVAVALLLGGGTAQAGLVNPGFEGDGQGSTDGWVKNFSDGSETGSLETVTHIESLVNPAEAQLNSIGILQKANISWRLEQEQPLRNLAKCHTNDNCCGRDNSVRFCGI